MKLTGEETYTSINLTISLGKYVNTLAFFRMLDEHFKEQMNEIIKLCPRSRQTLLFSATMTDDVRLIHSKTFILILSSTKLSCMSK